MLIATRAFAVLASEAARSQGLPGARIVSVEHPLGGVSDERLRGRAKTAVDAVLGMLTGARRQTGEG